MAIKYICDFCGKEMDETKAFELIVEPVTGFYTSEEQWFFDDSKNVCKECLKKLNFMMEWKKFGEKSIVGAYEQFIKMDDKSTDKAVK